MNINAKGVEAQEKRYPAKVRDDRFFVLKHTCKHVVFIRFRIVVTNEEDRTVSKCTDHQETSNILVMSI